MMSHRTGPVDPRLLHYTRGTRRYLVVTVVLGGITAVLVVAQAWLIANTISESSSTIRDWPGSAPLVALLLVVILGPGGGGLAQRTDGRPGLGVGQVGPPPGAGGADRPPRTRRHRS